MIMYSMDMLFRSRESIQASVPLGLLHWRRRYETLAPFPTEP